MEYIRMHIAAIALGLFLAVLGHDALMVTDPHPSTDAGHHESPAPADAMECGLTAGVHTKTSHDLDVDDLPMVQVLPQATEGPTGFLPHWSVEPDHPPDTRRALLQVFLN